MRAYTKLQEMTLRDILVGVRIPPDRIEEIFNMLDAKGTTAQMVFYYRACGLKQDEIGKVLDVSQAAVSKHLKKSLREIDGYLRQQQELRGSRL